MEWDFRGAYKYFFILPVPGFLYLEKDRAVGDHHLNFIFSVFVSKVFGIKVMVRFTNQIIARGFPHKFTKLVIGNDESALFVLDINKIR